MVTAAADKGVQLKVDGDTFAFKSLHEASQRVREVYQEAESHRAGLMDATIELGRWLEALRAHIPSDTLWGRHLAKYQIHAKKANRAMRLARASREGLLGPIGPSNIKNGMSLHQAELAAGIRKPAPPAAPAIDWDSLDGDDAPRPRAEDEGEDEDWDDGDDEEGIDDVEEDEEDEDLDEDEDDDVEMRAGGDPSRAHNPAIPGSTPGPATLAAATRSSGGRNGGVRSGAAILAGAGGEESSVAPGGAARSTGRAIFTGQLTFEDLRRQAGEVRSRLDSLLASRTLVDLSDVVELLDRKLGRAA